MWLKGMQSYFGFLRLNARKEFCTKLEGKSDQMQEDKLRENCLKIERNTAEVVKVEEMQEKLLTTFFLIYW